MESTSLGWHGLEGDRRFAFRRINDSSGLPWLTASRLPDLLLYRPLGQAPESTTHVRTPEGRELELNGDALQQELSEKHGSAVHIMRLNHGIFDEAQVSVINLSTIREVERESGRQLDMRRFRPNIVLQTYGSEPFAEDKWLGKSLRFGSAENPPAVGITMRDLRCVMINLDPDTAQRDNAVMKAAVQLNDNHAGAYGTVTGTGELTIGQKVYLA